MNSLILLPILAVVFYLLLIRPQQRRASQQKQLLSSVSVGERVVTAGGVFGRITELDSERMWLEVAPGVTIAFLRQSLARRLDERGTPDAGVDEDDMVSAWDPAESTAGREPAPEPRDEPAAEPHAPEPPVGPESSGDPAGGPDTHQAALEDPTKAVGYPGAHPPEAPEHPRAPEASEEGGPPAPPGAARPPASDG